MKSVKKNVKKSVPATSTKKKNIVLNKPKKVDPEQILKDRLAAKAKAKASRRGKINRTPEPDPLPRYHNGNVCEEMPVDSYFVSEDEDILNKFDRKIAREEIQDIKRSFRLDLGTDLDKFIKLLKGENYCPRLPFEPNRITAGRDRQLMVAQAEAERADTQPIQSETAEQPTASVAPITLTVKADDPSKLRGIVITIA